MTKKTNIFMSGRYQTVQLPHDCRFDCDEVFIRKDSDTGEVILTEKPNSWDGFFELLDSTDVPDDFLQDRDD